MDLPVCSSSLSIILCTSQLLLLTHGLLKHMQQGRERVIFFSWLCILTSRLHFLFTRIIFFVRVNFPRVFLASLKHRQDTDVYIWLGYTLSHRFFTSFHFPFPRRHFVFFTSQLFLTCPRPTSSTDETDLWILPGLYYWLSLFRFFSLYFHSTSFCFLCKSTFPHVFLVSFKQREDRLRDFVSLYVTTYCFFMSLHFVFAGYSFLYKLTFLTYLWPPSSTDKTQTYGFCFF